MVSDRHVRMLDRKARQAHRRRRSEMVRRQDRKEWRREWREIA